MLDVVHWVDLIQHKLVVAAAGVGPVRVVARRPGSRLPAPPPGKPRSYARDARTWEVGQPCSACEAAEHDGRRVAEAVEGRGAVGGGRKPASVGNAARSPRVPPTRPTSPS